MKNVKNMKKVGLLFGTFNPIHLGHLLMALEGLRTHHLEEIRFILTKNNPDKNNEKYKKELADYRDRAQMCFLALDCPSLGNARKKLSLCEIEKNLPAPNYTHQTLRLIQKQEKNDFFLLLGDDNSEKIHLWRESKWIMNNFKIISFNRKKNDDEKNDYNPIFQLSATLIRKRIKQSTEKNQTIAKNIDLLVPPKIIKYIEKHKPFAFQKK